eukprot:g12250.t1
MRLISVGCGEKLSDVVSVMGFQSPGCGLAGGIGTSIVAVVLLLLYFYSHRPRPDCGSSYRQHFAVNDLCAAVYARQELSAARSNMCRGLATGLPPDAPNCNTVGPCMALPVAMAGDSAAVLQEKSHQAEEQIRQSGGASAIGQRRLRGVCGGSWLELFGNEELRIAICPYFTRTATFLAVLGTLGALYEYLSMFDYSVHLTPVCLFKAKGCSWKVENNAYNGKRNRIQGTLLPSDPIKANCDADNNYCDHYWQASDFCSVEKREYVRESLTLPCDGLDEFFENIKPEHLFSGGIAQRDVKYVVQEDFDALTVPTPRRPDERWTRNHEDPDETALVLIVFWG